MKKIAIAIAVLLALLLGIAVAGYTVFSRTFIPTQLVTYRAIDGIELKLHVFSPDAAAAGYTLPGGRPAVLMFHGGAWSQGTAKQFYPFAQAFSGHGFVGISADYRVNGRHGTTAFDAVDDARAAYRYVYEHASELGINTELIFLSGGSAGGHLAAAVDIPSAASGSVLPGPAGLLLLNPALDTRVAGEESYLDSIAALFEGRGEVISPMHHIRPGLSPTWIAHGTLDSLVPILQSEIYCEGMQVAGNVCELQAYEGEGHGFFNWGIGRFDDVLPQMLKFIEEVASH